MLSSPFALRRRLIIGGLLAAAIALPTVSAYAAPDPGAPTAQCQSGEEPDTFTTNCVPFLAPNAPDDLTTTAANPDVPELDGVPCIGRGGNACIGLAESQGGDAVAAPPEAVISADPTVT